MLRESWVNSVRVELRIRARPWEAPDVGEDVHFMRSQDFDEFFDCSGRVAECEDSQVPFRLAMMYSAYDYITSTSCG